MFAIDKLDRWAPRTADKVNLQQDLPGVQFRKELIDDSAQRNYVMQRENSTAYVEDRRRLLSAEEEQKYGKLVRAYMKIQKIERHLARRKGRQRPTPTEVAHAFDMSTNNFRFYRATCRKAYRVMIDCNERLVVSIANKIDKRRRHTRDVKDLIMEGRKGLIRAVEKWDPSQGYRFSTYAYFWIKQRINRYILEAMPVKVPVHLWQVFVKIRKTQRELEFALDREPTFSEVGQVLNMTHTRVQQIIQAYRAVGSLDQPIVGKDGQEMNIEEMITDPEKSTVSEAMQALADPDKKKREQFSILGVPHKKVEDLVDKLLVAALTDKEAEIVRMRYGLDDANPTSLDEIAERFQVSRERARQVEAKINMKFKLGVDVKLKILEELSSDVREFGGDRSWDDVVGTGDRSWDDVVDTTEAKQAVQ